MPKTPSTSGTGLSPSGAIAVAAALAPGFLFGAHISGLVFFLNPHLEFSPLPIIRSATLFGALVCLLSLALILPWTWRDPARARRTLPWSLIVALGLSAALYGYHASVFAYFLPGGINVRMIKAAVLISAATLIAFYIALLHTLNRRPYGPRSRAGIAVLTLFSIYVMVERREAFHPRPVPSPLPSVVETTQRPVLVVVGVDGASLDALLPLTEQGHLPFFLRILREGAYGRLASLTPNRPGSLWATVATGKYPYQHGVVARRWYPAGVFSDADELRLLPLGLGFKRWGLLGHGGRGSGRAPRREAIALWEMLSRLGVDSGMVGWPESSGLDPAHLSADDRAGRGFILTDRFFRHPDDAGAAFPAEVAERARLFEVKPAEIDPGRVAQFGSAPPSLIVGALAGDTWRASVAEVLADQYPGLRAHFLHLPGLELISRAYFGGYAAAQFEGAQRTEYLRAQRLLTAYYAEVDSLLADIWARKRGPTLLVVVSAYGTEEPKGWRRTLWEISGARSPEGFTDASPDGVLLLLGQGIAGGALLADTELVDLVPTLLYGLGFPVARDLDGEILTAAFESHFLARHPLTFLPSYETLRESR